jgi:hypothetical protein
MTVRRYLSLLKREYGLSVTRRGVKGTAPLSVRTALAGHWPIVKDYLRRPSPSWELDLSLLHINLRLLGFVQMPLPDNTMVWVHPLGDDIGEQVLAGVINPPHASSPRERAIEDFFARGGRRPPLEDVKAEPVPGKPGTYRYEIRSGQRIGRLPHFEE